MKNLFGTIPQKIVWVIYLISLYLVLIPLLSGDYGSYVGGTFVHTPAGLCHYLGKCSSIIAGVGFITVVALVLALIFSKKEKGGENDQAK